MYISYVHVPTTDIKNTLADLKRYTIGMIRRCSKARRKSFTSCTSRSFETTNAHHFRANRTMESSSLSEYCTENCARCVRKIHCSSRTSVWRRNSASPTSSCRATSGTICTCDWSVENSNGEESPLVKISR